MSMTSLQTKVRLDTFRSMFSTHSLLIVIVCLTVIVNGGSDKPVNVCRYSSDGPRCKHDFQCIGPEVHCYKKSGHSDGRCCVKRTYACPIGNNRYFDPEGFPPLVHRCLRPFPGFFCGWGFYCRTEIGGPTEIYGVCCPGLTIG
ncbi:hypothetical protein CHS0354_036371 [Potamilus streckersoni]|uniref:Uncharacterized protein n=1 Tax=Potamilus streckersoni TaxID=2493646 RepID=A0AAE0W195_9BIVA|nr:hypothetical protein CHS0354_036371 [Potamilus streckersoni]